MLKKIFIALNFIALLISAKSISIKDVEKNIVQVKSTPSLKIYAYRNIEKGLGCIINKSQGLILITKALANHLSVCKYEITFHNGTKTEGVIKYFDQWLNLAIIKVDPNSIPKDAEAIAFSSIPFDKIDTFLIPSYNKDSKYTLVEANLLDNYNISGDILPQQCTAAQLKSNGDFICSPVFNQKGELVSVVDNQNQSSIAILDGKYIDYFLKTDNTGDQLPRKHIGIICEYYSLYDAVEYRNVDKNFLEKYIKTFQKSKGNILIVKNILKGSPAENYLQVGDIIVSAYNTEIGPELAKFDLMMSSHNDYSINMEVIRAGKLMKIELNTYDLEKYKIKEFVNFSSTLFFESDESYTANIGVALGDLTFYKSQNSSTFKNIVNYPISNSDTIYTISDLEFDGVRLRKIKDLITIIPSLLKKEKFSINYKNAMPLFNTLSEFHAFLIFNKSISTMVHIDSHYNESLYYTFDKKSSKWIKSNV